MTSVSCWFRDYGSRGSSPGHTPYEATGVKRVESLGTRLATDVASGSPSVQVDGSLVAVHFPAPGKEGGVPGEEGTEALADCRLLRRDDLIVSYTAHTCMSVGTIWC